MPHAGTSPRHASDARPPAPKEHSHTGMRVLCAGELRECHRVRRDLEGVTHLLEHLVRYPHEPVSRNLYSLHSPTPRTTIAGLEFWDISRLLPSGDINGNRHFSLVGDSSCPDILDPAVRSLRPRGADDVSSLGAQIYEHRRRLALSQARVAKTTSMSVAFYSTIENSKRLAPPNHTVSRFSRPLALEIDCRSQDGSQCLALPKSRLRRHRRGTSRRLHKMRLSQRKSSTLRHEVIRPAPSSRRAGATRSR
jgi:transcriptional regulator with XRE-family HTH domain